LNLSHRSSPQFRTPAPVTTASVLPPFDSPLLAARWHFHSHRLFSLSLPTSNALYFALSGHFVRSVRLVSIHLECPRRFSSPCLGARPPPTRQTLSHSKRLSRQDRRWSLCCRPPLIDRSISCGRSPGARSAPSRPPQSNLRCETFATLEKLDSNRRPPIDLECPPFPHGRQLLAFQECPAPRSGRFAAARSRRKRRFGV
jgi:hypothetical protein